jgi:hypothetical protein
MLGVTNQRRNEMSGYLDFHRTGNDAVDLILCAIENAGDAYHHTELWCDDYGDGDGNVSHIDRINAAIDAAAIVLTPNA